MRQLGKKNVIGILIDAVDYEASVEFILRAAHERRPAAVSALAVHGVMTGVLDSSQRNSVSTISTFLCSLTANPYAGC